MKLIVDMDKAELVQRHKSQRKPIFTLYFRINGERCYPSADWLDFGCIVMGWWLAELRSLERGAKQATLTFMEGPYALHLEFESQLVQVTDDQGVAVGRSTLESLKAEWCRAAEVVADFFTRNGIFPAEAENLRKGISMLLNSDLRRVQT